MTPQSKLAAELAEALRGILPMAREGQRARVSPSSHQEFIRDDLADIRMAEKALAKYDSAQSAQEASRMNPDYEELGRVAKQSYLDAIAYNPLITADALWPKVARAVLEAASRPPKKSDGADTPSQKDRP